MKLCFRRFLLTYNYATTNNNGNLESTSYSGGGLSYTQAFGYDALNRLTTSQENSGSSWSQTNSYDQYGNRSIVGGGLSFDANTNRISGWSYDAAGNLLNDGVHAYSYDAENKIKTVDGASAYVYDGEGLRVKKLVGENTRFVYGIGGELIAEYSGANGALLKEYVYGGGMQATIDATNGTQYTMTDNLGSPRVVTNASGNVVSRHDYMPFGEELGAGTGGRTQAQGYSVGDGLRQKFTLYERDNETGLDFAQARYFASTQGRFNSPDPVSGHLTDPQSWNGYVYVLNNPLVMTDPTGMIASHESSAQYYRQHDAGVYAGEESWGRLPGRNEQNALNTLDRLASEAEAAGDKQLAAGLRGAKAEIQGIIEGLRPGQEDVGVNAAVNAILNIGNKNFGENGTVTIGTVNGRPLTFDPGTQNKCNVLVAGAHADGAGKGFIDNGKRGKGYPLTDGQPPVANYLGDKNDTKHLTNLGIVKGALKIGDIIAWRSTSPGDTAGHSSIYIGGGVVVYAGSNLNHGIPRANLLNRLNSDLHTVGWFGTSWGQDHFPYVVRRYSGP